MFSLDTPADTFLGRVTRLSGWYIPEDNETSRIRLRIYMNGKPHGGLQYGTLRRDVAQVHRNHKLAILSGFYGDLVIPNAILEGEQVTVSIVDDRDCSNRKILFEQVFQVHDRSNASLQKKDRSFELAQLLRCEECAKNTHLEGFSGVCGSCGAKVFIIAATPHILDSDDVPYIRLTEREYTHPHGSRVKDILGSSENGIVLDLGAGNTPPDVVRRNICHLDVQQYPSTDLVCTTADLPFRDEVFDIVISQAVFEHLSDPAHTASEVHRVLKSGGRVYIDTAFMQPLHGDPHHYFNMTLAGLRMIMHHFEEVESGIGPHQLPSFGMRMQIEAVLPFMKEGRWKEALDKFLVELLATGGTLDEDLGIIGQQTLAAGFYYIGKKRA